MSESQTNGQAPESEIQEAQASVQAEIATLKDQVLRAHAEMENVRKRAERERDEGARYSIAAFARDMVAIADNLRRAIDAVDPAARENDPALRALFDGVELTERTLEAALERHGVKRLDPKGRKFDPNLHQAMFEVPNSGEADGTVVQVIEQGYMIGERLLRPALVGVAKGGGAGVSPGAQVDERA